MYELTVESEFAAAHSLREYDGKCENLHGHNWKVQVVLAAEGLDRLGMVIDFRDAKRFVGEVLDEFDHHHLNELEEFKEQNPTTENIARLLYEKLTVRMPQGVTVDNVTVWESERCGASYRP
ncbi:MAG: 6-carboxytetrahydropterin synthase QueD [Planctomycetes bacterium]|nr:6-carboxytetrahydropterin synthase QueD [Planctomycetota bacterium]